MWGVAGWLLVVKDACKGRRALGGVFAESAPVLIPCVVAPALEARL